jgi:hypothetical protein
VSDTPSDRMKSQLRRNDSRREPATIDLSATDVSADPRTSAPSGVGESPPPGSQAEDSSTPLERVGPSGPSIRPTPDEAIPSDDTRMSSGDADLSEGTAASESTVPPSSRADARQSGFPSLLAAGIIGGLLGGGATMLADPWLRPDRSQVDERLAQVERRMTAAQTAPGPLDSRMSRLETDAKALAERLTATQALAERSAKEAQEALNRPPAGQPGGADNAAAASVLADLATRLAGLEKQVQERTQTDTAVQERVAATQQQAQAATSAAQALDRRIADQDQRLAGLAKQFSERGPDAMAAGLRVTLADRLDDALQEGAPVGPILAMLRRLDVKPESLQPLEPYARNAPPSAESLAQEFRPLGQRMIAETRPPSSADWGERLWRMLDKVVTVRAVGDPKSTDVANLVARIEDALARDAVGEAAVSWDALPEPARQGAQEWGARLKQRAAAEAGAQKIYAEALSALEASMR